MNQTCLVISTHGKFDFDWKTGIVSGTVLSSDFGAKPVVVNVIEWKKRYPKEKPVSSTDVLDIGYIDTEGDYNEPCEEWREEREEEIAKESKVKTPRTFVLAYQNMVSYKTYYDTVWTTSEDISHATKEAILRTSADSEVHIALRSAIEVVCVFEGHHADVKTQE